MLLVELVDNVLRPFWVVWVVILFLGILFWAYRPKNKDRFESYGEIPLRDEEDKER